MPLIIRADANSQMGTGHVMRCIALGQAWVDGGREMGGGDRPCVTFICAAIPEGLAGRLQVEGFDLIRIDAEPGSPEDVQQTVNVIRTLSSVCWLVLDGYHFDVDYQRTIRSVGLKLLFVDDYNHHSEYECDLLLNQNINAAELDYTINSAARRLLGTHYAMLRREFSPCRTRILPAQSEQPQVLVTLGGADPDNVTQTVMEALQQLEGPDLHVKVIVGPANPHFKQLKEVAARSTVNIQLCTNVQNMPELMCWAHVVISAAGSTCWELCCLGIPFITLVLAENQRGLAAGLDLRGVAACLGENPSIDQIASAVDALMKDTERRASCVK